MLKEESALISLLYSLTVQLIVVLEPPFDVAVNLMKGRLFSLDGTMRTWCEALEIFEDLVCASKPYTICVVDGIEWTYYQHWSVQFSELWRTFCTITERQKYQWFKVLFTVAGHSEILKNIFDAKDIYEESNAK